MRPTQLLYFLSLHASLVFAAPSRRQATDVGEEIYALPSGGWVENLATRSNGHLLITRFDVPEIWDLDPVTGVGYKVAEIPNVLSVGGIAEIRPDVFAVIGGDIELSTPTITPGTWGVWLVDFSHADEQKEEEEGKEMAVVQELLMIPEAEMLNGMAKLSDDVLLVGDMVAGQVYAITIPSATSSSSCSKKKPSYAPTIADVAMAPPEDAPLPFGIDGMKVVAGDVLLFSNIFGSTLTQLALDSATGMARDGAETVTVWDDLPGDDFVVDSKGTTAYVATNSGGKIVKVVVGDGEEVGTRSDVGEVEGSTSVTFGRKLVENEDGEQVMVVDEGIIYVGTSAGTIVSFIV